MKSSQTFFSVANFEMFSVFLGLPRVQYSVTSSGGQVFLTPSTGMMSVQYSFPHQPIMTYPVHNGANSQVPSTAPSTLPAEQFLLQPPEYQKSVPPPPYRL